LLFDLHIGHPHNHLAYCFGSWPIQITSRTLMETRSFFSHHLGDILPPLFVIYSRHTTSSLHGDTRRLIRPTAPSQHTGNFLLLLLGDTLNKPFRHTGKFFFFYSETTLNESSATHSRNILVLCRYRHRQHMPEFILVLLWLICR